MFASFGQLVETKFELTALDKHLDFNRILPSKISDASLGNLDLFNSLEKELKLPESLSGDVELFRHALFNSTKFALQNMY